MGSCLVNGLDLLTRNVKDFKNIHNLIVCNPFEDECDLD
jgi:hypothetical protein